jgi:hypothetical protein
MEVARLNELLARTDAELGRESAELVVQVVTLDEFVAVEERGAAAVLGSEDGVVIGEGGDVMFYGGGGVGKTTLADDLGCHLAAGNDWLGIAIERPRRVLIIENEGPRPLFRRKLARKRDAWTGSPLGDRLLVLEEPWGQFSYGDAEWRQRLAEVIREREVDVVIVGPLTASGMDLPGTLQECRAFLQLVEEVRVLSGRRFANVLIHHENRGGAVSGAWEGAGDTLLHVQQQGRGQLRLLFQKARWSSEHHATALLLAWADGESFAVEEKPELDDETIAERILSAISADPGIGWTRVAEQTPGMADKRRRAIRDQLLQAEKIVNVVRAEGGELVALDYCPERRPAKLYPAADPAIRHLRLDPAADEPQTAAATGEGVAADLRPAAPPIRSRRARAADLHPSLDLDSDSLSGNTDAAQEAAERRRVNE